MAYSKKVVSSYNLVNSYNQGFKPLGVTNNTIKKGTIIYLDSLKDILPRQIMARFFSFLAYYHKMILNTTINPMECNICMFTDIKKAYWHI